MGHVRRGIECGVIRFESGPVMLLLMVLMLLPCELRQLLSRGQYWAALRLYPIRLRRASTRWVRVEECFDIGRRCGHSNFAAIGVRIRTVFRICSTTQS